VTLFYPSSTFGGMWCGFESDTLTWVSSLSNKYPCRSYPVKNYTPQSIINIPQNTERFPNMVNTRRGHVKYFICKKNLCNENWLESNHHQYHLISMNEGLLLNRIRPPAGWDHPEPSWFDCSRCTWMAINKLSINDPHIDNVPGAPPHEDTRNEECIDPQQPDLTCTPDPTKTQAHRQVVGVENAGGKAYGKATGLYNKHRNYSEQWNPWHPFRSAHGFQEAQSFSQQTKTWIDQHPRSGLDNFKLESFQSANTLWKLLSELDFGLSNDSWIEDDWRIFWILYYRDIFKCIQFLWAHLPFQAHHDCEPVRLTDSEGCQIYSKMNMGDWWWDTQDHIPTGAMMVPVICASKKTHWTNFSGNQHAWPLYLPIGTIRKDIRWTPKKFACILVGMIPCLPKGAKNIEDAWYSAVKTVPSQHRHLHLTGASLRWDCADGFQRQCYPLLAAWVRDYLDQVMVAQAWYSSCEMCEIRKGAPMGHSYFQPLHNSRDQHLYPELLEDNNLYTFPTLGFHPLRNQFWQYPLCNVYHLWQLDELHQLLLGLVKDLLHWLLKYLKARNVKYQFDNGFTSGPRYPGLQHFTKLFDSSRSGTWQGKEICGMIRTLEVNFTPILDSSQDAGKTAVENASNELVMGAVWALCEFSLLVSQQNHLDLSLEALDDALGQFYQTKGIFRDQKMLTSAKAKVDDLLAKESHRLREQKIYKIHATIEVLVYGAENVSTTKCRKIQVRLNRARQAATTWSDADRQKAIERLESDIHQVTTAKPKLFNTVFQDDMQQLL